MLRVNAEDLARAADDVLEATQGVRVAKARADAALKGWWPTVGGNWATAAKLLADNYRGALGDAVAGLESLADTMGEASEFAAGTLVPRYGSVFVAARAARPPAAVAAYREGAAVLACHGRLDATLLGLRGSVDAARDALEGLEQSDDIAQPLGELATRAATAQTTALGVRLAFVSYQTAALDFEGTYGGRLSLGKAFGKGALAQLDALVKQAKGMSKTVRHALQVGSGVGTFAGSVVLGEQSLRSWASATPAWKREGSLSYTESLRRSLEDKTLGWWRWLTGRGETAGKLGESVADVAEAGAVGVAGAAGVSNAVGLRVAAVGAAGSTAVVAGDAVGAARAVAGGIGAGVADASDTVGDAAADASGAVAQVADGAAAASDGTNVATELGDSLKKAGKTVGYLGDGLAFLGVVTDAAKEFEQADGDLADKAAVGTYAVAHGAAKLATGKIVGSLVGTAVGGPLGTAVGFAAGCAVDLAWERLDEWLGESGTKDAVVGWLGSTYHALASSFVSPWGATAPAT